MLIGYQAPYISLTRVTTARLIVNECNPRIPLIIITDLSLMYGLIGGAGYGFSDSELGVWVKRVKLRVIGCASTIC